MFFIDAVVLAATAAALTFVGLAFAADRSPAAATGTYVTALASY